MVCAGLGRKHFALEWLEHALADPIELLYWAVKGGGAWREESGGAPARIYSTAPAPGTTDAAANGGKDFAFNPPLPEDQSTIIKVPLRQLVNGEMRESIFRLKFPITNRIRQIKPAWPSHAFVVIFKSGHNVLDVIANAILALDTKLILFAPAASHLDSAALELGLETASEVFADRNYLADGSLVPR